MTFRSRRGTLLATFVAAWSLLHFSPSILAQTPDLEGVVSRLADDEGVANIRVEYWADGRLAAETVTDAAGFFHFRGGWMQGRRSVRVFLPNQPAIDVPLKVEQAETRRTAAAFAVTIRRASGIEALPAPDATPTTPANNHAIIRVFYATDRLRLTERPLAYGNDRNETGRLRLGRVDVSVPREHRMAAIERPDIWTFWREDPAKHFIILRAEERSNEDFYRDVANAVGRSARKEAFVFIHGYNVAFDTAVYRTAQIAYDLGFDGAPILYSWPSRASAVAYPVDAVNSDWTVPHLQWFLEDVAAKTHATAIHLIAHSMGNKPLMHALNRIATRPVPRSWPMFNEILLTAPDIDADVFVDLATAVRRAARHITLYASATDEALKASKAYQRYRRAGDTAPVPTVVQGIDTIDVSAVDTSFLGHSYYGDNRSVLSDIFRILRDGAPPQDRFGISADGDGAHRHWIFRP